MLPILFTENTTVFTSNGVGRLSDAVSCIVTEERNGRFDLTLEYPLTGVHFESIGIRSIIGVIPAPGKTLQAFRVNNISRPLNGLVTINAEHISYELSKNVAMPFSVTASASACNTVLQTLKSNAVEACPFTFWTDVNTVASYQQTIPATIRQRLGGVAGSVLDQYGGEFEFDNYTVKLHKKRGAASGITLLYGKNLIDLSQEEEISKTVTGIVPFWVDSEGGNLVTLPEKAVYGSHAGDYSTALTVEMDFSGEFQEQPSAAQLRTAANNFVSEPDFGVPKVSLDVSFVNLKDTEEYKDVSSLQQAYLCDTITVKFEKLGVDTTAKIVKVEFDVLQERYKSMAVGSIRANLSTQSVETTSSISSMAERVRSNFAQMDENIETEIRNATAWLTSSGGYVIAIKNLDGSWKELLFMDTDDVDTAINVLRINENGIGFSSNGVGGPYVQGWTIDGKILIGGTNAPSLTVYDNQNNILFQTDATKIIWNAPNTTMDAQGTITTKKTSGTYRPYVQFTAGRLIFGVNNSQYADITESDDGQLGIHSDTAILIEATNQTYIYSSDTGLALLADKDVEIVSLNNDVIIHSDTNNISLNSAKNIGIVANDDVNIDSSNGDVYINSYNDIEIKSNDAIKISSSNSYIDIDANNGVYILNDHLYVAQTIQANNPLSILPGDDPEIRFYDSIDNYDDNITLEGDALIIEADEIAVRRYRSSGSYNKGYTGSFTLATSGGGTATLNFVNGILVV